MMVDTSAGIADNGHMAKRKRWTADEDEAIRAAAAVTFNEGLTLQEGERIGERASRFADLARRFGRTVDAVRKRAQRIGAHSYPMFGSGRRS